MAYKENVIVFKALCGVKRLRILELLRRREKCACVLLEQLDLGQSGLSYHMKILVKSGIVKSRQEGKWTHYKFSRQGSKEAIALLRKLTAADHNCGRVTKGDRNDT